MTAAKTIAIGFILAALTCIPTYQWIMHQTYSVFPFGWMGSGLHYMAIFFHEIGHTLTAWFYGYFTVPMFDFKHGGGFAYSFGGQNMLILIGVWASLAYGIYRLKEHKGIVTVLVILLLFNLATFRNEDWHRSMIDFMGPAFEPLCAGFFLFRAIFDLAPRGNVERVANALFGFAMIFRVLIDSYGLLHSQTHRLMYYRQKGAHGFGDFDKVASRMLDMDFSFVVYSWSALAMLCLVIPFVLKMIWRE